MLSVLVQVLCLNISRLKSLVINISCMIVPFARSIEFSIAADTSFEEFGLR